MINKTKVSVHFICFILMWSILCVELIIEHIFHAKKSQRYISETYPYSFGNFRKLSSITVLCPFNLFIRFKCYNTV